MNAFLELDTLRACATELLRAEKADGALHAHVQSDPVNHAWCEECARCARERSIALEMAMRYAREWQRETARRVGAS